MTGKQFHIVWLLGLAPILSSCGSDTPPGAIILPVEANLSREVTGSTGTAQLVDSVHFKVKKSETDLTPVPDAKVDVFGASPAIGDPLSGFLTGASGALVDPSNPNQLELQTNAQGVVSVFYRFTVPPCGPADVNVTALISASIGTSTAAWRDDIKVDKC